MAPQHIAYLKDWMDQMDQFATRGDEEDGQLFSHDCFGRSTVVDADEDSATFEYTIRKSDCNFSGNFHGGAIATLIDNLTTAALFTRDRKYPRLWRTRIQCHPITRLECSTTFPHPLIRQILQVCRRFHGYPCHLCFCGYRRLDCVA